MPLIIVTGYPSSGKTTRSYQIKTYFENVLQKPTRLLSEEDIMSQCNTNKNALSLDSKKQKEIRASLKCNVVRSLGSDIVILDASNNVKGFRYELYCACKCHKTSHCVVECDISVEKAWELNENRENKYSREAFDAMIALFEPPVNTNRWDSPLITVQLGDDIPGLQISNALFDREIPRPNMSTQNMPMCNSTYLSDVDKITRDVIQIPENIYQSLLFQCSLRDAPLDENAILALQANGSSGKNVILPPWNVEVVILDELVNARRLGNLKRQFISFYKLNPVASSQNDVAKLFIKFINSSLCQPNLNIVG